MKHYADQGYEIALDDVGAGHSGLNRVVNTTPDYLKADIELVRDIYKYKKKEIMMKLLLDYCNATRGDSDRRRDRNSTGAGMSAQLGSTLRPGIFPRKTRARIWKYQC